MKRYALIFGGGLRNKGAQAMTFISVDEVRARFPGLEPVVVSDRDYLELSGGHGPYSFEVVRELPLGCCRTAGPLAATRSASVSALKHLLRRASYADSRRYYDGAALALDVSGFAFGDKWGAAGCRAFLDRIELLGRLGVPLYLLPQSFGPFDFERPAEGVEVRRRSAALLGSPRIIFSRERSGAGALLSLCPGASVRTSADMVLQSAGVTLGHIYDVLPNPTCHLPSASIPTVGVVPNRQNYERGDVSSLDEVYRRVIALLLDRGFEVAVIRHASEDLEYCARIKSLFADDRRVEVYGEDRPCHEYGELFSRLRFLIASRFHSIVHAFKVGVPCIALGWAEKYEDLLALVGYPELMYDVTNSALDLGAVERGVSYLIDHRDEVSRRIRKTVAEVQRDSVFDAIEADLVGSGGL